MRQKGCLLSVLVLLSAGVSTLRSGEPASPRAILDKAIQAAGGEANLSKNQAVTMKGKGTFHGLGQPIPYEGEWAVQWPGQMRFTLSMTFQNQPVKMTQVLNGGRGWIKIGDQEAVELKKAVLAEEQERLYAGWVARLTPLKDRAYQLAPAGEAKVDGRAAVGVRVSQAGHRDVTLFFDSETGLLLKSETRVKDLEGGGEKEVSLATSYSNYKEFGDERHPTRIAIEQNGKSYVEAEFTEIRPLERLEDNAFGRP